MAQHLRAWIAYSSRDLALFYWRTRSGVEVDFVVYGAGGFWAFEVTNATRVRPEDVRGLRTFASDYPRCRTLSLYRGSERLRMGGVRCVPVEAFLAGLRPGAAPPELD